MLERVKNIKDLLKTRQYQICIVLSVLLVTVICLWNIGLQVRVRRVDDEIGYWGIAAQLAGYEWKDIMSHLSYYSFGYSFLLVPFLWLHRLGVSMTACYQMAIILNVLMLDATIFMALYVAKKWAPKTNKYYRLLCVLAITLYSNNILHSNTAWPEICIYFLYWCLLVLILRVFEYENKKEMIAVIALSVYMFTVHMRTIAIPIAVIATLVLWFLRKRDISKERMLKIGVVCVVIIILLVTFFFLMKNYVEGNIYHIQDVSRGINTFDGNIYKLHFFTSIAGWIDIALSFLGKIYYQGIATFLLSYLGFGIMIKRLFLGVVSRNDEEKREPGYICYFTVWVILATLGSLLVSALFKFNAIYSGTPVQTRADDVIYGRYTEFMVNLLILIACLHIGQLRKYAEVIVASLVLMLITALAVQHQWNILSFYQEVYFVNGVDTIAHFFEEGFENTAYYAALWSIGIFGGICFVGLRKSAKAKTIMRSVIVIGLLVWFVIQGMHNTVELAKEHKEKTVDSVEKLIIKLPDLPVYCVGTPNADIKILQWEISEREIDIITAAEVAEIATTEAIVISAYDHVAIGQISDYMDFLYSSGTIAIYANKESYAGQVLLESINEARSVADKTVGEVELANVIGECGVQKHDGYIYSLPGKEGAVTDKTGLYLDDGVYEFEISLQVKNIKSDRIGYVLATNMNDTSINTVEIKKEDIKRNGDVTVSVLADIEDYSNPRIQVYSYGNCDMVVEGMTYQQVESVTPRNEYEKDELRRIFEIVETEKPAREKVYYVDADGSGVSANLNMMGWQYSEYTEEAWGITQLPYWSVKYLTNKNNCVFVMEKTGEYKELTQFLTGFTNRYETKNFILYTQ